MTNAFIHPQRASYAFQLSESQLKCFASLGSASDAPNPASAESVLPFAKEQEARTESIISKMGGPPALIYKNNYDKQPLTVVPPTQSCVVMKGDPRFASMENIMKVVVKNGWNQAPTNPQMAPGSGQSLQDASSPPEDAASSSKNDASRTNKKDK